MRVSVSVLSLLILVELLASLPVCKKSRVAIVAYVRGKASTYTSTSCCGVLKSLTSNYGESVSVICSGTDSKNLKLIEYTAGKQEELHATEMGATTVKRSFEKLEVKHYFYVCKDQRTNCSDVVNVNVEPAFTIKSKSAVKQVGGDGKLSFFLPIAEDFEIFCSANSSSSLSILKNFKEIPTYEVNRTTIKTAKLQETAKINNVYSCRVQSQNRTKEDYSVVVLVHVDYLPLAKNLWCVAHQSKITCHWDVWSKDTYFTLSCVDEAGNYISVCEDRSNKQARECEWDSKTLSNYDTRQTDIYLSIKSCNLFLCTKQNLIINRKIVTKPEPLSDLTLLRNTSSFHAVISWCVYDSLEYKVAYRMPGSTDQELEESSLQVTCSSRLNSYFERYSYVCQGELKLPCPDTRYEVKVYAKHEATPRTNDAYWSDPATLILRTSALNNSTAVVDPACNQDTVRIPNKYVAVYKVQEFERSVEKDGSALRNYLISMRHKIDKIKEICRELSLKDCVNFEVPLK